MQNNFEFCEKHVFCCEKIRNKNVLFQLCKIYVSNLNLQRSQKLSRHEHKKYRLRLL